MNGLDHVIAEQYYFLKSKTLLQGEERHQLIYDLRMKYVLGDAEWYEGQSLNENGWIYLAAANSEISPQDLEVIKRKGLTLLLTQHQLSQFLNKRKLTSFEIIANYPIEVIDSPPGKKIDSKSNPGKN